MVSSRTIERDFTKIDRLGHIGVLRNGYGFEEILDRLKENSPISHVAGCRISSQVHAKPLGDDELRVVPVIRFSNALRMWKGYMEVPKPIGLIYEGHGVDFITGDIRKGYYLSHYIEGDQLMSRMPLNSSQLESFFDSLNKNLRKFSEEGIYPLDFAPRDIVLREGNLGLPVIVDTEHVAYAYPIIVGQRDKDLLKQQRQQFLEDYGIFLNRNTLRKYADHLFSDLKDK